jgi:hypothetical protein
LLSFYLAPLLFTTQPLLGATGRKAQKAKGKRRKGKRQRNVCLPLLVTFATQRQKGRTFSLHLCFLLRNLCFWLPLLLATGRKAQKAKVLAKAKDAKAKVTQRITQGTLAWALRALGQKGRTFYLPFACCCCWLALYGLPAAGCTAAPFAFASIAKSKGRRAL